MIECASKQFRENSSLQNPVYARAATGVSNHLEQDEDPIRSAPIQGAGYLRR